jgi:hypothetical protein
MTRNVQISKSTSHRSRTISRDSTHPNLAHQTGDALTKGKLAPAPVSASSFKILGRYNFCHLHGYSDSISLIFDKDILFVLPVAGHERVVENAVPRPRLTATLSRNRLESFHSAFRL